MSSVEDSSNYPPEWWYDTHSVNEELINALDLISNGSDADLDLEIFIQHRLVRKYYLFKNRKVFAILVSTMFKPQWCSQHHLLEDEYFAKFITFFASLKRKQLKWMKANKSMRKILIEFKCGELNIDYPAHYRCLTMFINRMFKYNVIYKDYVQSDALRKSLNRTGTNKGIQTMIRRRQYVDHI